uniref:Uncharacterized protein n=1 Tax=Fagus sylvatica TaxID=28930 RepID=A0A2N9GHZ1_FAGSY
MLRSAPQSDLTRIVVDVAKNLERAQRRTPPGVLDHHHRRFSKGLEPSRIFDWRREVVALHLRFRGPNLSLPPIASNDPNLSWVWAHTATVLMGQPKDRTDAAQELAYPSGRIKRVKLTGCWGLNGGCRGAGRNPTHPPHPPYSPVLYLNANLAVEPEASL